LISQTTWSSTTNKFSEIIVFGDSLSDSGNFASLNGPLPSPPFFNNRISNGLTSVDLLAQSLNLTVDASLHLVGPISGTNFAVVGARTGSASPLDLFTQINEFLSNSGGIADPDALYVVSIGGNDVRDARDTFSLVDAVNVVETAVNSQLAQIERLILSGARNLLIVNVADIGSIPETRLISNALGMNNFQVRASNLSRYYNDILTNELDSIEDELSINFLLVNQFNILNQFIRDANNLGFENTTQACFSTTTLTFSDACIFGTRFDQFIFFDEIHPTARVNQLFAQHLVTQTRKLINYEDSNDDKDDD